jgi:ABC-type Fe3+-hydroxamate transport system substrate-binding protein
MKFKFDTILAGLMLALVLLTSGCVSTTYERDTYHQGDDLQTVTDAKGNQDAIPQETVVAKSKGVLAKKAVKDFRFESENSWDGTTYTQSKSVSAESVESDVSEQTTKIVESAVKGAVSGATGLP